MTTLRHIIIGFILTGFISCDSSSDDKQTRQQNISIEDRVLFPKTPLSQLVDSLRPATQTFVIKGDRDTLIVGKKGTIFTINKNSFINSHGQPAKTVNISVVEAITIDDFIKSNLQTNAGDNILQSGGMFFIDAKENNASLKIADGKSIYVEVKANQKDSKMSVFQGNYDKSGKINWTTSHNLDNNLITLPLDVLNFARGAWECALSKEQVKSFLNPKFENTFIATREFEERVNVLHFVACQKGLSQPIIDIYTNNIDKNLCYSDSLVVDYFEKHHKNNIDTLRKFQFDDIGWITAYYQTFIAFKKQRLTNTINFTKLGITESSSVDDLKSKGYSDTDAEKIMTYFRTRQQIIKSIDAKDKVTKLASYSFSINNLGWVNVDKFYDDPEAQPSEFITVIDTKDSLDFISVSLIIPRYNISVFSIHNDRNLYSFTKKNDGYRKLPVGQDAIIVALSYKNSIPYFGNQKIKIPKDGQIQLQLTPTTAQAIKQDIAKLME
jgi:hypothetical protein